jgi:lysophospholipid acyltransferase (LPLAT)-like uncharacterized protein
MRYRVDNVPRVWRPCWLGFSWTVGVVTWLLLLMLHASCKITMVGRIDLWRRGNFIYSLWDRKTLPFPFSRLTVVISEPIVVTENNFEQAAELLVERMTNYNEQRQEQT